VSGGTTPGFTSLRLVLVDVSSDRTDAESKVSGNQANVPARLRRELGIDDGDHRRWHLEDDGSVRVEVVRQRSGTFAEFDATRRRCADGPPTPPTRRER